MCRNSMQGYLQAILGGLDFLQVTKHLGEKMARAIEVAVLEPVEGKTRAQQIASLKSQGRKEIERTEVVHGIVLWDW